MSAQLRQRGPAKPAAAHAGKAFVDSELLAPTPAASSSHGLLEGGTSSATILGISSFTLACLLALLPLRLAGVAYMPILDCDETFNYWEPLHHLLTGRGLQTWEYSPAYGLRSYLYLLIVSPAAWIAKWVLEAFFSNGQEANKVVLFYLVRGTFALGVCFAEVALLSSIRHRFGPALAKWTLLFLAASAGMGHAAVAFLPQTFTMVFVMLTLAAWLRSEYKWAIGGTAVCALIGWPFSGLISLPLALEVLWVYRGFAIVKPVKWGLLFGSLCVIPSLVVDHLYYRKTIFAVLNIALYNSNAASDHGANLYGREPASFYLVNLTLNFNLASVLAYWAPSLLIVAWGAKAVTRSTALTLLKVLTPFFLWFGIFVAMPHKEERFLFVVYPYLCLAAAVSAHLLTQLLRGSYGASTTPSGPRRFLASLFVIAITVGFVTLSASRTASLILNYRAPMQVWTRLHETAWQAVQEPAELPFPHPVAESTAVAGQVQSPNEVVSVCVGKEWYRFSSAFFTPTIKLANSPRPIEFKLRFLDSDFGGLLPKDYTEAWEPEAVAAVAASASSSTGLLGQASSLLPHGSTRPGTFIIPRGMNELNAKDDSGRFVRPETCAYIVDLALGAGNQNEPLYEEHEVRLSKPQIIAGKCVAAWRWQVAFAAPFLDAGASSSSLMRAFYIPFLSDKANVFKPYQLLERFPVLCTEQEAKQAEQQR